MDTYETAIFFGLIGFLLVYQLPSIIAFLRGHPNRWLILILTTFLGATVVIWALCLLWSLHAFHRNGAGRSGGASGLNVILDDHQLLASPRASTTMRERLDRLLLDGSITREQYDRIVATL